MWDLPGPGLEPVSPALAGGFLTTAPPGKPPFIFIKSVMLHVSPLFKNQIKHHQTLRNNLITLALELSRNHIHFLPGLLGVPRPSDHHPWPEQQLTSLLPALPALSLRP